MIPTPLRTILLAGAFAGAALGCSSQPTVPNSTAPTHVIHVNQHAYLPKLTKQATYTVAPGDIQQQPRQWNLRSGDQSVATGVTRYWGLDKGSKDIVHIIDFSPVTQAGRYRLEVLEGGTWLRSFEFEINSHALAKLQYEALAYFYHNRSDVPILEQYVEEPWHARPVGHPDTQVRTAPCFDNPQDPNCRTFDGSGGWYDAGDHGKYVVNGGISVWTLLNMYERAKHLGHNLDAFADGTLAIPENRNGVPDLLDEVRYQLDWYFRMQVPQGYEPAGMVHHKLHSVEWTSLPMAPHEDTLDRIAQPVSTAATLNFAANMAQCARVFRAYDKAYADRCLEAARSAYSAAHQYPEIYALANTPGAGPYGDRNLGDEFYWAATELYLSTGEVQYGQAMVESPYHLRFHADEQTGASIGESQVPNSVMSWPLTHMLGILSTAVAGSHHHADADLVRDARAMVITAADHFVATAKRQGYGQPYEGTAVVWGSNSDLVNNMLVLGLANDFSCGAQPDYLNTLHNGMSYLFGRNPLSQSYITRYGSRPLLAPHHRFWAHPIDSNYPSAPAGVLSGGPNKEIQDPPAQEHLQGCAPLKCFIDDIGSWSTNEITINWNAPLAWVVAYLHEQANLPESASCRI